MKIRTYAELSQLETFEDRFEYLKLNGKVSETTFGFDRFLNQKFYKSPEWKRVRRQIIVRDMGCDLGIEGREIKSGIIIHHMNPITVSDIKEITEYLLNPDYLISTCHSTHNSIHYSDKPFTDFVERSPNDTCPWKR